MDLLCSEFSRIDKFLGSANSVDSNIEVFKHSYPLQYADIVSYVAICKYCKNRGLYNGVYKLNFSKYLDEIKQNWNTRANDQKLNDIKIWIESSSYLIIYNLGLVRFGDFESQILLSILQDRIHSKTAVILEPGKYGLLGKPDSIFFSKLKTEFVSRGVDL
jgi:hypothetical protein